MIKNLLINIVLAFIISNTAFAQSTDSANAANSGAQLSVRDIILKVISAYPSVKEAEEALNAADAKIGLANSGYYPIIDFKADYANIGPVPYFSLPGLGSMNLAPSNNYEINLGVLQKIYDFGKTGKSVDFENENKNLSQLSIEQIKQKLSLTAVASYYALIYLQEAISIKEEQLKTLREHLEFIEKKKETGSATQYEILSTQVKISGIESQKLDIETAKKVQLSYLNSLLGESESTVHSFKKEYTASKLTFSEDSLITYAVSHRDEINIAREKEKLAKLQYDVVNSKNNPVLSLFLNGGAKNGYEPKIEDFKADYSFGLMVKVSIFDANVNKNDLLIANSSIRTNSFQTEIAKRNITNDVIENEANLSTAYKKVEQFELQLKHAEKALELAKTSYKAGVITNLDLLDAATAVSESRLYLLKAQTDYNLNIYKLKAAIGERLY